MRFLKGFFITILLIIFCFLGIYLGAKIGYLEFKKAQTIPQENNLSENIIEQNAITDSQNETTSPIAQDFSGKWTTVSAVDTSQWNTIENLTDIFGSSYLTYGSYLQLNSDNTFLDAIYPVTSDEVSVTGTYSIQNNYYKLGDAVIILDYSDGRQNIFKVIYEEENIPILMQDISNGNPYQFNLKRK